MSATDGKIERKLNSFANLLKPVHGAMKQEQQRVAVGPENAYIISICQLSSDAPTLRPLLLCIGNLLIKN